MKKALAPFIVALPLMGLSSVAKADLILLTATLTGSQEFPPTGSPGIGSGFFTLDDVTHLFTVNIAFAGLLSPTVASHVHCCTPPGANAIVATPVPTFPGFPLGVTTGTYLMTFDLTLASSYNPAFITAHGGTVAGADAAFEAGLVSGLTYLNIHTSQFPGGEIRGQLSVVPEPGTMMLVGTGLVGMLVFVGKRKRSASS